MSGNVIGTSYMSESLSSNRVAIAAAVGKIHAMRLRPDLNQGRNTFNSQGHVIVSRLQSSTDIATAKL